MQFFKRILNFKDAEATPPERRGGKRFAPSAKFPLKAVLNVAGRDETGAVLKNSRGGGWDWSGRLVNFSESGARIQLPPAVVAARGDPCLLKLSLEGFDLKLPGRIANAREQNDSILFGLTMEIADEGTRRSYRQLIELVALGATLKPLTPAPKPDKSGRLMELYEGDTHARLSVWRDQVARTVNAFEFMLKDCVVRGTAGSGLEYLTGSKPQEARRAPPSQTAEIHRLFHWVVPNLAPAVPADVRKFLQAYAA